MTESGKSTGWSKAAKRRAMRGRPIRPAGKVTDDNGNCLTCGLAPRNCDCK